MQINFDAMETTVIPHMRGGEKEVSAKMYIDPMIRIMRGRLIPGATIGLHTHESNCEVIHVLSGTGKVVCDGESEPLSAGSCHYCPKGHAHTLINDNLEGGEDLVFFAVIPEQ